MMTRELMVGLKPKVSSITILLDKSDDLAKVGRGQANAGIGGAVENIDLVGLLIQDRRGGEDHVGHETHTLVELGGRQEISLRPIFHFPRLVQIEERAAHGKNNPVTSGMDAV